MQKIWLLFLIMLVGGCVSKSPDTSKVLARFDGTTVTENDFLKKVEGLPRAVQAVVSGRRKDVIEDMAAEHFLLKEAKRRGLDEDADVQDLIATAQRKILIAKLIQKEVDEKITIDATEIAKYYEFHENEFMTPLLFRASHILVKAEEEAARIKIELETGADFEETARQKSADATAIRGGDLGFFQKGQFVPEFEAAIFEMKKGEIRGPVKTPFGYHVIRLNDRVEPRLRPLKAVKTIVEERLAQEKRSKAFKELVEKLKGNAKIDIDEKALEVVPLSSPKRAA